MVAWEESGTGPPAVLVHGITEDRRQRPRLSDPHGLSLAWVRAQPVLRRLSIIILTASNRSEDVNRAFDLGATSFLVKPIELEALASMLRRLCDWAEINRFPALHEAGGTNQATIDDPGGKEFQ